MLVLSIEDYFSLVEKGIKGREGWRGPGGAVVHLNEKLKKDDLIIFFLIKIFVPSHGLPSPESS